MTTYTIELSDAITVKKQDGAQIEIDVTKIPDEFLADFVTDGIAEYVRDSSSAALAIAYDLANPDHKLEGKKLLAARAAWKESNVDAIAAQSVALMNDAIERMYSGERRKARESAGPAFSNVDNVTYSTVNTVAMKKAHGFVRATFEDTAGMDTAERKAHVLAAMESWPTDFTAKLSKVVANKIKAANELAELSFDI